MANETIAKIDYGVTTHQISESIAYLGGRYEEVEAMSRRDLEALQSMDGSGILATIGANLAGALLSQGRASEAIEATRLSEANAPPDDVAARVEWMEIRASALAARGRDLPEAVRLAHRSVQLADTTDYSWMRGEAHESLGIVLCACGREDEARSKLLEALRLMRRRKLSC